MTKGFHLPGGVRDLPRAALFGVLTAAAVAGCGESPLQRRDAGGQTDAAPTDQTGTAAADATMRVDPGRIGIHFLNNTEYDNTVKDLLGVTVSPASRFPSDRRFDGFDNNADELGAIFALRYQQFFFAAKILAEQVFADQALRSRIVSCTPAPGQEMACGKDIIRAFGLRAWRRPLADIEVDRLFAVAGGALAAGEDFLGAMQQVVTALLSSFPFLYHVELDDQPTSETVHPLTPYELASRLSYLLWRSMPDDRLFALAASGDLGQEDVLAAQAERMLADPRSAALARALADGWLGAWVTRERAFDPDHFPSWDDELRAASLEEAYRYVAEFLLPNRSYAEFLTADINFVNARLARHYGFPAPAGTDFVRVEQRSDQRKGYLGLASFLSATSWSNRTSPTGRGVRILDDLLCDPLPPPPPDVEILPPAAVPPRTIRGFLDELIANPACSECHKRSDPIGLGLENFDPIGQHRTHYANGEPVDLSALSFAGKGFVGLLELAELLTQDPRFAACAPKKLFTYALRRPPQGPGDRLTVQQAGSAWVQQGLTLRGLIKQLVVSPAFRFRRGEAN